ncbi:unnamed protein product [Natator depressus]
MLSLVAIRKMFFDLEWVPLYNNLPICALISSTLKMMSLILPSICRQNSLACKIEPWAQRQRDSIFPTLPFILTSEQLKKRLPSDNISKESPVHAWTGLKEFRQCYANSHALQRLSSFTNVHGRGALLAHDGIRYSSPVQ